MFCHIVGVQLFLQPQILPQQNTLCFVVWSVLNCFFSLSFYLNRTHYVLSYGRCSTVSSASASTSTEHTMFCRMVGVQLFLQPQLLPQQNKLCFVIWPVFNCFFSLSFYLDRTNYVLSYGRCSTVSSASASTSTEHTMFCHMVGVQLFLQPQILSQQNTPCFVVWSVFNCFFSLSFYLNRTHYVLSHGRCSTVSSASYSTSTEHMMFCRMVGVQLFLQPQLLPHTQRTMYVASYAQCATISSASACTSQ